VIFLLLAVLSNTMAAIMVRFSESNLHNRYAVTMFNYLIAVLVSYFFIGRTPVFSWTADYRFPLLLGIWNGALFIAWLFIFQVSVRHNGAPLSATFAKLGVLLPTAGAVVFFAEKPSILQIIGIAFALLAIVLFNLPESHGAAGPEKSRLKLLLFLVLLIGGVADFNSKIFETFGNPALAGLFLLVTFVVALLLSLVVWLVKDSSVNQRDVLFGVLIGLPNQLTAMFLLLAIMQMPAYLVFPVYSVGVILLVSLVNGLIFKEKLTGRQQAAMALVCLALVLLNV